MPGPHLTLHVFGCFPDVGGCDVWLSNWWDEDEGYQWWTGWHSPRPLSMWKWPGGSWTLIGHERWDYQEGHSWLSHANYAIPNPSTTQRGFDLTPRGHWQLVYNREGQVLYKKCSLRILKEGNLYLKGSGSKGEGKGQNLSVCNHMFGMRL